MTGLIAKGFNAYGYDPDTGEQVLSCKTLLDSEMSITVEELLLRAGQNMGIIGSIYHSGDLALTLNDQEWNLEYLAMKNGGAITATSDLIKTESFTLVADGEAQASHTVAPFDSNLGTIGWYKLSEESEDKYKVITFDSTGKATLAGVTAGTTVCLKYPRNVVNARELVINSNFAPRIIRLELETPILKSSASSTGLKGASEVGKLTITIPQFQFNPTHTMSVSSGSGATNSLSGRALENIGGQNCTGSSSGYFAIIKEEEYGADEFTNVETIVIPNNDIELEVAETTTLRVLKLFTDSTLPAPITDPTLMTFTSLTPAIATVDVNGVITAVSIGSAVIEAVVTSKPELTAAVAHVTVA